MSKSTVKFIDEKTGRHRFVHHGQVENVPNIVLITIDMVSPDFYLPSRRLAGEIDMPAFKALQRDSVVFQNAFSLVPLCGPSRAILLTGRYTYVLGNGEHAPDGVETEVRADDVIFPEYLKRIGYATKHVGKCHVGTEKFMHAFGENDCPWNQWYPPIFQDEGYVEYQRRLGVKPQKYSKEIVFLQGDRVTSGNSAGGWIVQDDGKPFPLEAQYSQFLAKRAEEKIDHALSSPKTRGQPIYLQLDIFDPHQPFSVPDGYSRREKELRAMMTLPKTYEKTVVQDWAPFEDQPEVYDLYRRYWGLYNPQSVLDYRVANALQMEVVDAALSRVIRSLKERDLYDNSMILVMSDHGEMNGRWGLVDKGVYLYPDVMRTPLVIKPPSSMGISPRTVTAPVSLLDVAPTVLSMAGVEPEARLDGQSLIPYLREEFVPVDRDMIFSCGWHVGINFACGIQRWDNKGNHHLYAFNASSDVDELYDLNKEEAENLAQDGVHAKLKVEMIERLGAVLQADTRWGGYYGPFRLAKFSHLPKSPGSMQKSEELDLMTR
ncbi:MAG: sulfatase-like hydrolase/transferase [Gallionella sp.]|jgi:arylsulfatase A-like enzyme|nr:sulfatase-like hydrolase/transferase [Gallionella sp.]